MKNEERNERELFENVNDFWSLKNFRGYRGLESLTLELVTEFYRGDFRSAFFCSIIVAFRSPIYRNENDDDDARHGCGVDTWGMINH